MFGIGVGRVCVRSKNTPPPPSPSPTSQQTSFGAQTVPVPWPIDECCSVICLGKSSLILSVLPHARELDFLQTSPC
jgi:hypothetical protein